MELNLEDINRWNNEGRYKDIIAMLSVQEELSYELRGKLISALNNNENYIDAYHMSDLIAEQGINDPVWYFRKGYGAYYMARYEEASMCFSKVLEYMPGNEDALEFLMDCNSHMQENQSLQVEVEKTVEDFELVIGDLIITASEVMVRPSYSIETREVSIEYFHHSLVNVIEDERYNLICTALEYIVGEEFFKTYIGNVDFTEVNMENMISVINIGCNLEDIVKK